LKPFNPNSTCQKGILFYQGFNPNSTCQKGILFYQGVRSFFHVNQVEQREFRDDIDENGMEINNLHE